MSSTLPLSTLSTPKYGSKRDLQKAESQLKNLLGSDNVSSASSIIKKHADSASNSHHPKPDQEPDIVVFPSSTNDVSKVMKIAHKYRIPVIPFGGGTALEGHFNATRRGIVIDLRRMDKILAVHERDLDVVVQPAVGWVDLNQRLAPLGLMFGPDPSPGAKIGGMIATSCSGTNAFRFGTMKENVIGLTAVLPDGTIIKTRRRPKKTSAGYNLTGLFVGSEGTLGVITEATLKLVVKPENEIVILINFKTIEAAAQTTSDLIRSGIQLNALEIMDEHTMIPINEAGASSKVYREEPTLLVKVSGSKETRDHLVATVEEIAVKNDSTNFEFAITEKDREELWRARKVILWSTIFYGKKQNKDSECRISDIAVPVSQLATMVNEARKEAKAVGMKARVLGHVGDGNLHFNVLYTPDEKVKADTIIDNLAKKAIDLDGTCTGEHGIGMGKREFLVYELGEPAIDLMRKIKQAIDPLNIMNPDKVFYMDPNDPERRKLSRWSRL